MSDSEKIQNEILKNSKYRLLFSQEGIDKAKQSGEEKNNKNENSIKENNNINKDKLEEDENKKVYEKIDKQFTDLRKLYPYLKADQEAEEYIDNLRDIGEYNRWSLKLSQLWLLKFYQSKFWIEMGLALMRYKKELNPEKINLDICTDFIEGYYFHKDNSITLCANTLTNYESPSKFNNAIKRHLILMYDNLRSKDFNPRSCQHLACSEIRAANLAGYCTDDFSYMNSILNSSWNKKRNNDCVKSKANEHMMVYYDHCTDKSINYINEVWDKCYIDTSPIRDFSKEKNYL